MSLLSRLRSWFGSEQAEESNTDAPREDELGTKERGQSDGDASALVKSELPSADERAKLTPQERLLRVGLEDGPTVDEAIAFLRQARGTLREAEVVAAVLTAIAERPVPEPVRVACADILAARGDEREALRLLEGTSSTTGLMLASDLYAANGQLARAVGTIERVLARDINAPGARERHARWSAALGYAARRAPKLDEATVVAPNAAAGPFRLVREVARGGAGTIYEAEDEMLGRRIAFKVYHRRGEDRAAIEREVRVVAALAGPGVVRVFDADAALGWIALEWVPRGSVRDLLRTGELEPLAAIARWARPLAHALSRVHEAGYVHADIKPANVLLRAPNDPVLSDFGLARPFGASGEGGSPGYVSPERLAGRASDPRDDIYGYGRVLEDVLLRLETTENELSSWHELALACVGPDDARPPCGAELVRRLP